MSAYVALLRGINVGGHRRVPMAELRDVCAALGFGSVATYVQSGNVVFTSDEDADEVRRRLEAGIAEHFGFAVDVIVRTRDQFSAVAAAHPLAAGAPEETLLHVFFLADQPDAERVAMLDADRFAPDELVIADREVFVRYAHGAGRSKLKVELGPPATARNWRTIQALRAMAEPLG